MLDELVTKVKEIYSLLIGTPTPEEEEENKGKLEGLFKDIIANINEKPELKPQAEEINQILIDWDPLDFWFKEVKDLSTKMKEFIDSYYHKQEEPNVDTSVSLDDASVQLLKAAGIDVEKLIAAGVTVDIDKLKAVLLSQESKVPSKEIEKEESELESDDEEERKRKLGGLLKKTPQDQNTSEQKRKLLAPIIEISGLNVKKEVVPEQKEEIKQASDRIVINQQSKKMKIKIKAPTKIDVNESKLTQSNEPQQVELNPHVNVLNDVKPIVGPKITINASGNNNQMSNAQMKKISISPNIQPSNINPIQINSAPAGAVIKPSVGPAGAVIKPSVGPAGLVIKTSVGPTGAVERPSINSIVNHQNTSKSLGNIPSSSIKPIGKVELKEKVDFKAQKTTEDEESIYNEMNKETLLQEMIFLQNKQFYFEKSRKILTQNHKDQKISDADYRGDLERFKFEIERIGKNLEEVRNRLVE